MSTFQRFDHTAYQGYLNTDSPWVSILRAGNFWAIS